MVEQQGMVNHLFVKVAALDLTDTDVVAQTASQCFDVSVWQFLAPLLVGGRVRIFKDEVAHHPAQLLEQAEREKVTIIEAVPSMLRAVIDELGQVSSGQYFQALRWMISTGEALPSDLCRSWLRLFPDIPVMNAYGPTECSDDVTHHPIYSLHSGAPYVAVGRPVENMQAYVLDRIGSPAPVSVSGEIHVGGIGVCRGYIHETGKTAEVFIPDPFSGRRGARLYRTGDLARRLHDGNIEFLGRIDHQVKVRGFRIELGEIETVLNSHDAVSEAVVVAYETRPGDQRLIAYVVADRGQAELTAELRSLLKDRLPEYMTPAGFVLLDELPLNSNGKVDRRALPPPEDILSASESEFIAPRSEIEELLAGIWAELLQVESVGVGDNFFDLGGHSLLATQMASRVRAAFRVELPLRRIFEAATVAELAVNIGALMRGSDNFQVPPLLPVTRDEPLPLSFAQQRLWFIDQLEPNNYVYNVPVAIHIRGRVDINVLERSFNEITRRHEALRTVFRSLNGQPIQVILPARQVKTTVIDLRDLPEDMLETESRRVAAEKARAPFDLSRGPLFKTSIIRLAEDDFVLLINMHHIVSDAWSVSLLLEELSALYEAYSQGEQSPLAELPVQYADFTLWQRRLLSEEAIARQVDYWRGQLAGGPAPLVLPTDRPRPARRSYRGSQQEVRLSHETSEGLKRMSRREGATLFMTLLAAFQILLNRYSGQSDVAVGFPIANRSRLETEKLVGFFVNTLVIRADFSNDLSFREVLRQVRQAALGAYAHQDVPFERLVEELQPERDLTTSPLFQAMFVLQDAPLRRMEFSNITLEPLDVAYGVAKFDLLMNLWEWSEGTAGILQYNTDLFDASTIKRMADHFAVLLKAVIAGPAEKVSRLPLLTPEERHQLLVEWNNNRSSYPKQLSVQDLLEAQAHKTPDAVAVVFGDQRITYADLRRRANRLATYLRELGVGPDVLVGIYLPRSVEMIVALIAVLKAGGGYVPLDPAYPEERLRFILSDSNTAVLLTTSRLATTLAGCAVRVICLDTHAGIVSRHSEETPAGGARVENLAYLIYTSGSTGKPKGVAIEHRSVVTFLHWAMEAFSEECLKGVLASTSICFDLSVFELFGPLCCGGKVILAENALSLPTLTASSEVTLINTVPSAMAELLRLGGVPPRVKAINLAGEPLQGALVRQIYSLSNVEQVFNLYGPSEDTTYSTYAEMRDDPDYSPTIGRPIADTQVFALDSDFAPVPIGAPGELLIAGEGLARGYFNRPEPTAEKFTPNPFGADAGSRMYKTGDLVRYRPDGNLEFLGRIDHQVKIRGYRIELGEIEAVINAHSSVRESVVIAREDTPGDKRIVAYFVPDNTPPSASELRDFIKQKLPEYMLPSALIMLEALPLTPNGKIDRRALPSPGRPESSGISLSYASTSQTEEIIAGIFGQVLRVDGVNINDNFFDLGGHSLLAVQVISRLRETMGVELPLRAIFEAPTVAELAETIKDTTAGELTLPPLSPAHIEGDFPLSSAQQRLWFLDRLDPGNPAYNLPGAIRLIGVLDVSAMAKSLAEIRRRHQILRTTFTTVNGCMIQRVNEAQDECLPIVDLSETPTDIRESVACSLTDDDAKRPFDLQKGPLMRTTILKLDEDEHIILLNLHHIIADGWSFNVLLQELSALYEAYSQGEQSPLAELPVQYADFTFWQRRLLGEEAIARQVDYWRGQLAGGPAPLALPTGMPRPARRSYRGSQQEVRLSHETSERLKRMSRREGTTLFMTLLAGLRALLYSYTLQDDIGIGAPVAGRRVVETEVMIGLFVNTLVLRIRLNPTLTFTEVLKQARYVTLEAHARQDVPFERLVETLQPDRDPSGSPFFQAWFVLHDAPSFKMRGLTALPLERRRDMVRHDLRLGLMDTTGEIVGSFEYRTEIFSADAIINLAARFESLLEIVVARPEIALDELVSELVRIEEGRRTADGQELKAKFQRRLKNAKRRQVNIPSSRNLPEL